MIIGEYTISEIFDGEKGEQGVSVSKVVTEWTKSTSSTALPSNPTWSETKPAITSGEYLWYRDRTDLSDGNHTYSPAVCDITISGVLLDVDRIDNAITSKVWQSDINTSINSYDGSTVSNIRDRVTQTEQDITGITTRVSDVESTTDDLGTRMTSAESSITQNANNINLKVSKNSVISEINQSSESITISADKVNIEGATIFSSGRLSTTSLNNTYDAKGAAATAKTEAINSANSATDTKLQSYSTTSQMNTAISNAVDDVEANAIKTTVPVYYRSTTNSTPSISASTSIGTSNNTDNAWSYVMPLPKKNSYFYICEEYTSVSGTKTFSTVRKLDSQTYASKWVSSNDNTLIDGGSIYAHSITSSQLATDAIKSNNYQAAASGPYSVTGTFLDLSNGNFYTPNFGVQSLTGQAYLNGEIIATSGSIGDDSGNYWSIGNTTDSQGNGSASIVGNGTAYIQDGDWQIHSGLSNYSNGSINTQWYIQPQGQGLQLTYPYYDGYYYDYGMTSPVLDASSDRFYNQTVSQNFLYIRKHASTIPALESDWNYIFRVDKDGMIWINGQSLTQMIQSGVDGGAYLPTSGGTVNGNVTITGTLTATASKANQLTHTLSINGKGFDGSGDVNVGTIGAAYGGTGQTSLVNSANALLNALGTGSSTPVDNDYYISQYVGGGTTTTTYHRRPMSALWSYIKGKLTNDHANLDNLYVLKSGDTITGSLTVENGIYSDSAQLGDLIVTGAGRFANGLYGDLIGNADTATKAAKVADSGNGTETTFAYSKSGLTTASWIAAWSGYELRAISPANLLTTIGAQPAGSYVSKSGDTMTGILAIKPSSGEGGQINLHASTANTTQAGISIDQYNSTLRIFGIASADGTTKTGVGSVLIIDPYAKTITGGYTITGTLSGNASSASKLDSSRSFTIGKTAKTVDWSGAVSFSQAEISDNASTTAAGWMSKDDKVKLNGIETGAQVNTITGVKGNSESSYRTGNVNITATNIGLGNLTNNKQVKGLSSGTTSGHFVTWGSDGYTVADSGITAGNVVKSVASNASGQLVLTYADNTTSDPIDVEFVATETSSVQKAEALNVNGVAVGGADQPVYFTNQGKPTTANKIPKLNNTTTGGTFYAPTGAGTSGQILQSSGGTPSWVNQNTLSVGSASTAGAFSSNASVTLTGDTTGTASSTKGWTIATTTKKLSSSTTDSLNNFIDSEAFKYTYAAGSNSITDKPTSVDAFGAFSFKTAAGWYGQLLISSNQASGIYWRTAMSLSGGWRTILDSTNYTDYTVTKTGTGASGTWGINITGSADSATSSTNATNTKYLMNRGANTVTIADSSWNHGQTPSGQTNRETVWKQKWTQSGITYTPSGGSATTNTDSADLIYWLSSGNTNNILQVNMAIDGMIYALGGFKGNLNGNASTATTATNATNADNATTASKLLGFSGYSTSIGWGNQTGTPIMVMNDSTGGSVGFRRDNPSGGQTSMVIDGTVYIKEGQVSVGDAIKTITRSGTTFTYTTLWGATGTFTQQDSDTQNTAGSTNTSSEIYLVGATSQAANPQTYSHDTARIRANGNFVGTGYELATSGAMSTTKAKMVYDSTLDAIMFVFE